MEQGSIEFPKFLFFSHPKQRFLISTQPNSILSPASKVSQISKDKKQPMSPGFVWRWERHPEVALSQAVHQGGGFFSVFSSLPYSSRFSPQSSLSRSLSPFTTTDPQVTEEVICPKLQELLFFMHSFLTAKVRFITNLSESRLVSSCWNCYAS